MEDKLSIADYSPPRSSRRQSRLAISLTVFAIGIAALVAVGPFLVVPVYMVLHDNFLGRTHPQYDGVSMRLSDGQVIRLLAGGFAGEARSFYVEINGAGKLLEELSAEDLVQLGFRESSDRRGVIYIRGPERNANRQSVVDLHNGKVDSLYLLHPDIRFGAHREGPFLELPVSFDRVEEVFGEPVKWNREKVRWF